MEIVSEDRSKENFNVFVGTNTGLVKGINFNNRAIIVKNFSKGNLKTSNLQVSSIAWNNDNENEIVVGFSNKNVSIFDTTYNSFLSSRILDNGPGSLVSVGLCGRSILTGISSGEVSLWKGKSEKMTIRTMTGKEYTDKYTKAPSLSKVKVSPSNSLCIATGGCENDLKVWDLVNHEKAIFQARNVKPDSLQLRVPIWITDLAFMPNSNVIATCSRHSHVRLYDPKSFRRPILSFEYETAPLTCIASVPNQERQVIVGSSDGRMALFDLRSTFPQTPVESYKGLVGGIKDIIVHKNLPFIFSVSADRFIRVHELTTRKVISKHYLKSKLSCVLLRQNLNRSDFEVDIKLEESEEITVSARKKMKAA